MKGRRRRQHTLLVMDESSDPSEVGTHELSGLHIFSYIKTFL
jgi:hypothetical protein